MKNRNFAVLGIGATGTILASALLSQNLDTVLVDPAPNMGEALRKNGLRVSGEMTYSIPVNNFSHDIPSIAKYSPEVIFIASKTVHLSDILNDLQTIYRPGVKIISTHNGLGTEDLIADNFGSDSAFRMSLNYGAAIKKPGHVEATFFNPPNHLGALSPDNREFGEEIAELLTVSGLDTAFVDDIKWFVWKKMILKCTMSAISAVTDRTIKDALAFPPTREIAVGCFKEALAVAKAMGYDLGDNCIEDGMKYLEKVGTHRDSMCADIANQTPTEVDFLGGKIVDYGREAGLRTPFFSTMTNLVKSLDQKIMDK